jgi:hypothetical protein
VDGLRASRTVATPFLDRAGKDGGDMIRAGALRQAFEQY